MKVMEVLRVSDWDGGDRHNFSFFLDGSNSPEDVLAKRQHCEVRKETLIVYDSLQDAVDHSTLKLAQAAWDRLRPEERKALGLTDRPK